VPGDFWKKYHRRNNGLTRSIAASFWWIGGLLGSRKNGLNEELHRLPFSILCTLIFEACIDFDSIARLAPYKRYGGAPVVIVRTARSLKQFVASSANGAPLLARRSSPALRFESSLFGEFFSSHASICGCVIRPLPSRPLDERTLRSIESWLQNLLPRFANPSSDLALIEPLSFAFDRPVLQFRILIDESGSNLASEPSGRAQLSFNVFGGEAMLDNH
jgi:hypothetical protein